MTAASGGPPRTTGPGLTADLAKESGTGAPTYVPCTPLTPQYSQAPVTRKPRGFPFGRCPRYCTALDSPARDNTRDGGRPILASLVPRTPRRSSWGLEPNDPAPARWNRARREVPDRAGACVGRLGRRLRGASPRPWARRSRSRCCAPAYRRPRTSAASGSFARRASRRASRAITSSASSTSSRPTRGSSTS